MPDNAYTRFISTPVPQSKSVDERQVKNNAGGYVFTIDDKARLERFLILGTDGGTYYVKEQDLTKQNLDFLAKFIKQDPIAVMDIIRDVSVNGRAFRNSPAIFATAMVMKILGESPVPRLPHAGARLLASRQEISGLARKLVREVCRTSTHLYEFAGYIELLGGWGRSKRSAVAEWYEGQETDKLAYQAVKYRSRGGWTHRDLFRLAHPEGVDVNVGNFILGKSPTDEQLVAIPDIIRGFVHVQAFGSVEKSRVSDVVNVLDRYPDLPWEAIPTQFLKEPDVWKKLFYNGQLKGQALIRNITRLARIGAFNDMVFAVDYAARLTDPAMIAKTRLHPINYLNALIVHTEGQVWRPRKVGDRPPANVINNMWGGYRIRDWETVPDVIDALNEGFHLAFKSVEPAQKRTMIALDVSGSMAGLANGLDMSCAQVTAAMSMTVARTEPFYMVRGFSHQFTDLGISPGMNLTQTMHQVQRQNFGRTDCALPMVWAKTNKVEIDTFMIYTDNETWHGRIHPHVALQQYRDTMGIDAKLIVAGVAATDFTIADPSDRGMMDVVGFDSNAPKVMADFSGGRI